MIFQELQEYKKDVKDLLKKYRTLTEDMEVVKKVLTVSPDERPPFSFRIDNLGLFSETVSYGPVIRGLPSSIVNGNQR